MKKFDKRLLAIIAAVVLLVSALAGGVLLAEEPMEVFALQADDDDEDNELEDDDFGEADEDDAAINGTVSVSADTANAEALAEITAEEAAQVALAEHPDAQLDETELEVENGFLVYEVELDNGMEIIVDAGNGEILHSEMDN